MRRILVTALATFGAMALLAAIGGALLLLGLRSGDDIPDRVILEFDFETDLVEYVPEDPLAQVMLGQVPTTRSIVEALERARDDDRVVALIARVGSGGMGLAQVQELRDAVSSFRSSGKPAIAWAETIGGYGGGDGAYYLAAAFDELHVLPGGLIGLEGIMVLSPFFAGALEKAGVIPRLDHRWEYKNAMNVLTEREFTDAHRESFGALAESQFGQIVRGIAAARGLSEEEVRGLIDSGPFLASEALEARLVDSLAYRDEIYGKLEERVGSDAQRMNLRRYGAAAGSPHQNGTEVALVYGVGEIQRGKSHYGLGITGAGLVMGSDSVTAAFRAAIEDADIRAILFRVDSPGGSAVASDAIAREVQHARAAGKPVIVSMADVAGSGGYWVSMDADRILAQPATLTGSIGVIAGKFVTAGLLEKLGFSWDQVRTSRHAGIGSQFHDFSESEWERVQASLDRTYDNFTSRVAAGRGLPVEDVLEVAKGRVWTGEDALARGLVDELGGFPAALAAVRKSLDLAEDAALHVRVFPEPKGAFDLVLDRVLGRSDAAPVLARGLEEMRSVLGAVVAGSGLAMPGEVLMPPLAWVQ